MTGAIRGHVCRGVLEAVLRARARQGGDGQRAAARQEHHCVGGGVCPLLALLDGSIATVHLY